MTVAKVQCKTILQQIVTQEHVMMIVKHNDDYFVVNLVYSYSFKQIPPQVGRVT